MALITPSNYEYSPTVPDKVVSSVRKRIPFFVGRFVQYFMYGLFQVFRFLQDVVRDAIGK